MIRLLLALAAASFARAGVAIHWEGLAKVLQGQTVEVVTNQGEVHHGRFAGSRPDALLLKNVEIARGSIVSIRRVYYVHGSHLKSFEECVGYVVLAELICVASPGLPLAVAALPVTGAVALGGLPILAIWDLFDRQRREENIVLLPDPAPGVSQ